MEKLTLEHIAPYLPYGLNLSKDKNVFFEIEKIEKRSKGRFGMQLYSKKHYKTIYVINDKIDHKLVLRPMDLTKPIIVEGKEIIPIVELAKMALLKVFRMLNYDDCVMNNVQIHDTDFGEMIRFEHHDSWYKFICECDHNSNRFGFYFIRDNDIKYYLNQLALFKKLYEWKFDVFGLIEKGLAIDVNTLEVNPYN